ncbi:M4 family metallopeptidase [Fluoribacter gormanii]|uniref:Neutral metalloproteinase n=1 Tax=Fluoribacter gormanii TaxID=464 RepID=A0A377GEJ7_9GAMM|nr:M4 family metallopeptidase [Fluoribacter gormanii]KTD00467.1 zinc metalloproteinase precursor [Fluoribacter gormanii]SIR09905.1 Msp peptidase. Metallo peptidase. MEROPS family M04 [Fluoribacter gormanii]STO23231.1 Hemagglutinin/proteinase precursor [Fluoribacter gormanii]
MLKKILSFTLAFITYDAFAVTELDLYQAPLSSLNQFSMKQQAKISARTAAPTAEKNTLQQVSQTQEHSKTIMRYQQIYRGIPVVGAQVMITKEDSQVNGHLLNDIQLNTQPTLTTKQAIDLAKKSWFSFNSQAPIYDELSELQIRASQNNELKLVYQVSFKTTQTDNKPAWPFFIIDAQSGEITKQWNNIKNFMDIGPGGNEKVHEYWYGRDGLPYLEVTQNGSQCVMNTAKVKLVNLASAWDWNDLLSTPFQYPCSKNTEENINGAFSPTNDAYYFGQTIVDMYKEWYGVNALQDTNGAPMQLVMRVHFGQHYDNAFWDGQFMSFGDGEDFYPLVSLDVAGHEVTHGFTEQHSGLEYHDQSGALNESLSDMAGQAARAYLLEQYPKLYNKLYLDPNIVTWGIGETIVRDSFGKALRFMDFPSSDGSSADCLDKSLAQSQGAYCAISYPELVAYAKSHISNPQERQSFIVHTASGVFNKAFYLLAKNIGIKQAYQTMIIANSKYWTPTTNFIQGACGVLYAAKDLRIDSQMVKSVFGQVGVSTTSCMAN